MTTVHEAMLVYRAAVENCRSAEYIKQQAAQALYEARQAAGAQDGHVGAAVTAEEPDVDTAFEARIAYVEEPTKDGRVIKMGAINWQFGQRVPVTSGFEGGTVIGHAIPSHIDEEGAVMATVYIDDADALRRIGEPIGSVSLGVGLDHLEADVDNGAEPPSMVIKAGRLRVVAAQPAESAAWPGCVVQR